ncbi:hypothetical protein DYB26_008383 [Aphanomyces astaci]|uniref:Uncharacterized protein n=1 Tax=Aphanomyces astaci TaxID=112090 RepID=A0A397EMQ0_APHAT|nr:hypothetical protein DYB34_000106 [Aphanomyces astaci]RHZ00032.1 hypothetical protein DYB31_005429 [Aphanomyces astaci]RHZ11286.1 hypothetical protein DYB26_008383 [Aphanomyces astaci]
MQESGICISYALFDGTPGDENTTGDLESLLEMDVDIYGEQDQHLGFDPCVSLETLVRALQSPHGSNTNEKTWNEEGENNDVAPIDSTAETAKQDRRRLSLRKELFQHRIKAQDLSSPGPKSENDGMTVCRPCYEQPEYDLASPLALPPSPTSFYEPDETLAIDGESNSNQDDARPDPMLSKASTKLIRGRKVKHGGIYSLLLKGLKRTDDYNDSAVLVDSAKENTTGMAKNHAYVTLTTDAAGEVAEAAAHTPSKRMSPSPSKMQVRHGGIYRMLREKT